MSVPDTDREDIDLLDAANAKRQRSYWRPIETAPKDGTKIILWWNGTVLEGYWLDNSKTIAPWSGWKYCDQRFPWPRVGPTMWHPMPALRSAKGIVEQT
jgi:hypothetical protein